MTADSEKIMVYIPGQTISNSEPDQGKQTGNKQQIPRSLFSILVIDDDKHLATTLSKVLTAAGYACSFSFDPTEALTLTDSRPFDLIITDIHMPGMSGVDFAQTIQQRAVSSMIIFMTADAELQLISRAMTLEPFGYLEKPFKHDKLLELVAKAYERFCTVISGESERTRLTTAVQKQKQELKSQYEQRLAEKELLQGIVTHANFGLIAVDMHLTVSLVNQVACTLLSQQAQDRSVFVGAPLIRLLPVSCRSQILALCQSVQRTHQPQERTFTNPVNQRLLHATSYPIFHNNELYAVVLLIHDNTEKELLQKSLLQSAKLASIGSLAAGVAHEINNPLGFVISNINTMSKFAASLSDFARTVSTYADDPRIPKACQDELKQQAKALDLEYVLSETGTLLTETDDGLKRMARIVKDLKSFAHEDSEVPDSAQVNELIEKGLNLVRNEIKYKLEVEKSLGELPKILCFPSRLVQVFTNLFINAAQATEQNGKLIIRTSVYRDAVEVRIKDTGHGIEPQHMQRIFEPFFTTKPMGVGMGMGLSICYAIIQRHNGTITFWSEVNKGTEFVITLPIKNSLKQSKEDSTEMSTELPEVLQQ